MLRLGTRVCTIRYLHVPELLSELLTQPILSGEILDTFACLLQDTWIPQDEARAAYSELLYAALAISSRR